MEDDSNELFSGEGGDQPPRRRVRLSRSSFWLHFVGGFVWIAFVGNLIGLLFPRRRALALRAIGANVAGFVASVVALAALAGVIGPPGAGGTGYAQTQAPYVSASPSPATTNTSRSAGALDPLAASPAARRNAIAAARQTIAAVETYRVDDLAGPLAAATRYLTPSYAQKYKAALLTAAHKHPAQRSTAKVTAGGVADATTTEAHVLVFADLEVGEPSTAPVTYQQRLLVTLQDGTGRWLVDGIASEGATDPSAELDPGRANALRAAERIAQDVYTYRWDDTDRHLRRLRADLTPQLYQEVAPPMLKAARALRQGHVTVMSRTPAAGIEQYDGSRAVVLVSIDQDTKSASGRIKRYPRTHLTLQHTSSGWVASAIK